jgi:hypothetical protein
MAKVEGMIQPDKGPVTKGFHDKPAEDMKRREAELSAEVDKARLPEDRLFWGVELARCRRAMVERGMA